MIFHLFRGGTLPVVDSIASSTVDMSCVSYLIDYHCLEGILHLLSEVLVCLPAANAQTEQSVQQELLCHFS